MEDILYNKVRVLRFINSPVPSNAYLLIDDNDKNCIVIDPGSKDQSDIRDFILLHGLFLDYIILTHEHFDHCWGVNSLLEVFNAKVVATRLCAQWVMTPMNYFNQLYFDSEESYSVQKVDLIAEEIEWQLPWQNTIIRLIDAKGHTNRGLCVSVGNALFTGDTMILNTKPFLKKKYGASLEDFKNTIDCIYASFDGETIVYPGHGDCFKLEEMRGFYEQYFQTVCVNNHLK
jgi:glyoxylase-like metal-dependent hydrolase (beta-lactamase superfamily II)